MIDEKKYSYKVSAGGRVNVIGEHIDYCGGKVFPITLSLKNTVYVRPNGTNRINVEWTTTNDKVSLDIDRLADYGHLKYGKYQAGSALMWQRSGKRLIGCDMLQVCDVPFGSGLSSSAAIEVSTIAALATVAGEKIDPVETAILARQAEHEYVGVNCGIMDQYASACGRKDTAMLLDCKTLDCEYVPFVLNGYSLVIANCNKPHDLIASKYNERRAETEEALRLLQTKLDASCLADVSESDFERVGGILPPTLRRRAGHIIAECARVIKVADAMKNGDVITIGKLLDASHKSLKEMYEVTGKELDALQEAAKSSPYCVGSRMTGAGFGGCAISLVKNDGVDSFKSRVRAEYLKKIGYEPSFYDSSVGDGITITEIR